MALDAPAKAGPEEGRERQVFLSEVCATIGNCGGVVSAPEAGVSSEPSANDYALVARTAAETPAPELPYLPPMPRDRDVAIALVGAGGISGAHLEAYACHGFNVVAVCSRNLARAKARRDAYFPQAGVTDDFESLLGDPDVRVLDIDHPCGRSRRSHAPRLERRQARPVAEAVRRGRRGRARTGRIGGPAGGPKLAVNQNGRWGAHFAYIREAVLRRIARPRSTPFIATCIGTIVGSKARRSNPCGHLILYDFGIHWFDFVASVIGERGRLVHATAARAAGQTVRPPLAGPGAGRLRRRPGLARLRRRDALRRA